MNYWWVNHKQTFRQEFSGKYVWCPKLKSNGQQSHYYESMREVQPGDLLFSYAYAAVQGFGFARTHCYSCPKPDDFGKVGDVWNTRGWRVDVEFQAFSNPLRTADYASEIAPLLPNKYSPIRADGFGNQVAYFAMVPEAMAMKVAELADPMLAMGLTSVGERENLIEIALPSLQEWEDRQQQIIAARNELPLTTREALIQSRIGQGLFKQRVGRFERACRITKVDNPTHLIASHIKPWRESDDEERLSAGNGLLLTPSIDHLFDRGFISFADDGELIASPIADKASLKQMGVATDEVIHVGQFNTDQKHFLDYHRKEILLKSAS
ncbi:HNH endonuclease [Cerasicoccus arenae]|uniref:HNH endonuclease n=1 Tax=Cerasicoccus arenae TaxID=424488 RepID=A0A8J3GDQ4_9BACT|nr:HNH endonuclease signature motif containing protein [Cerasicoccus arenae]MBK1859353.1 HNH endonuclease [Cerasicoccus arenae]GHB93364.1 HNH endonuclease [Cerasicoccus arenae]